MRRVFFVFEYTVSRRFANNVSHHNFLYFIFSSNSIIRWNSDIVKREESDNIILLDIFTQPRHKPADENKLGSTTHEILKTQ